MHIYLSIDLYRGWGIPRIVTAASDTIAGGPRAEHAKRAAQGWLRRAKGINLVLLPELGAGSWYLKWHIHAIFATVLIYLSAYLVSIPLSLSLFLSISIPIPIPIPIPFFLCVHIIFLHPVVISCSLLILRDTFIRDWKQISHRC